MKTVVTTKDKNPRVIAELSCDLELLVACIKDGELIPAQVAKQINEFASSILQALHKGVALRKQESEEP